VEANNSLRAVRVYAHFLRRIAAESGVLYDGMKRNCEVAAHEILNRVRG
jgi:hypothetical protein